MDPQELRRRLMAVFLTELEETVNELNGLLVALEQRPAEARDIVRKLMRAAHSLKGAARSVGLGPLETLFHRMEDLFTDVREREGTIDAALMGSLFEGVDLAEQAGAALSGGEPLDAERLEGLAAQLGKGDVAPPAGWPVEETPDGRPAPATRPRGILDRPSFPAPALPPGSEPAGVDAAPPAGPPATRSIIDRPSFPAPALPPGAGPPGAAPTATPPLIDRPSVPAPALPTDRQPQPTEPASAEPRGGIKRDFPPPVLPPDAQEWSTPPSPPKPGTERREKRSMLEELVRVPAAKLDALLRQTETLALDAGGLTSWPERVAALTEDDTADPRQRERLIRTLSRELKGMRQQADRLVARARSLRMRPFAEACAGLDRVVRDVASAEGKQVELIVEGGDVELDGAVLGLLRDPLRHLVRNAIDHGLETPEERQAAGKTAAGQLRVSARVCGPQVEIEVGDDGRGLDLDRLRAQAARRGLPDDLGTEELAQLVFLPGLSTAKMITRVSGRGVGLDVVKEAIEGIHGSVRLRSRAGDGATFVLAVPLTLSAIRGVLVEAGGRPFVVPSAAIVALSRFGPEQLRRVGDRELLEHEGGLVPLAPLAEVLGLERAAESSGKVPAVLCESGGQRLALGVDRLVDERDVVVKGLGPRLAGLAEVSGATVLADGRLTPILNLGPLVRRVVAGGPARSYQAAFDEAGPRSVRIVLAEDGMTTRAMEKSVLESAGYQVRAAANGALAWGLISEHGADLVVSDVDMPEMTGFELAATVRASARFKDVPFILVTARESPADRARGLEVGADAYLPKRTFDHRELLATIEQLLL